jgi:hypothetical protein
VLEVVPADWPVPVPDVDGADVGAVAGVAADEEPDVLGAVWILGLLTLIVGPLFDDGTVAGTVVRGALKYMTIPMIIKTARITPTITPTAVPPPVSVEPGGVELIWISDTISFFLRSLYTRDPGPRFRARRSATKTTAPTKATTILPRRPAEEPGINSEKSNPPTNAPINPTTISVSKP